MGSTETALQFSENVRRLQPSATISVSSLAKELQAKGRDIINLSAGEPDFPTPAFIAEAGIAAIRAGRTRYTPAPGLADLRAAVAAALHRDHGAETDAAGVVVSSGAKQALFNAIFVLTGPGDAVMVPVPYWTSYPELVRLARAEPVWVRGPRERAYKASPEALEDAWTPAVRALLINTPSNPSGAVYTLEELTAIAEWARARGVWLISDEIYARLCYVAPRAPGLLNLPAELRERVVVVNGASKAFAMTGWRIGFSYTLPALASKIAALQSHMTSNAATPSQYAALAAFTASPEQEREIDAMAREFRARRDLVAQLAARHLPGADALVPDGAFYLFLRADQWYDGAHPDSVSFCRRLIEEAGVALVPGSAFGEDRYVRLSFAASRKDIEDAFLRIARALGTAA